MKHAALIASALIASALITSALIQRAPSRPAAEPSVSGQVEPSLSPVASSPPEAARARAPRTRSSVRRAGASVLGVVVDERGEALGDLAVALRAADGALLDEAVTDEEGLFSLVDRELVATRLVFEGARLALDGDSDTRTRELAPLSPGERRELRVVLVETREVVGWVLDLSGDTQPGVQVTLWGEQAGGRWTTLTGEGGEFRFDHAPATPVRIDANGWELGRASSRLATSPEPRREISLVLEPTGSLTVFAPKYPNAEVVVLCWDELYHGPDGVWDDELGLAALGETPAHGDGDEDTGAPIDDEAPPHSDDDDALSGVEPRHIEELEAAMTAMEEELRAYDPQDPEGSLARVLLSAIRAAPELAERATSGRARGVPEEQMAREAAAELFASGPKAAELLERIAAAVQDGESLMDAAFEASAAIDPAEPGALRAADAPLELSTSGVGDEPAPRAATEPDWEPSADPALELLDDADELERGEGSLVDDGDELEEGEEDDLTPMLMDTDPALLVAHGQVGQPIEVRGSFVYAVRLRFPDGLGLECGSVRVDPGQRIVFSCGSVATARVTVRLVDGEGRPLAGLIASGESWLSAGRSEAPSDHDGRFGLSFNIPMSAQVDLYFSDPDGRQRGASRRNINLLPGGLVDLGEIVVHPHDERPEGWPSEAFGGIGGLIELNEVGVSLDAIEPDVPLTLAGANKGDSIMMIDGVPAAELPMDEILRRLRGEVGTRVGLRLRSSVGELYELELTRALIPPGAESWPELDGTPTEDLPLGDVPVE